MTEQPIQFPVRFWLKQSLHGFQYEATEEEEGKVVRVEWPAGNLFTTPEAFRNMMEAGKWVVE
jgi:hypothetical protein